MTLPRLEPGRRLRTLSGAILLRIGGIMTTVLLSSVVIVMVAGSLRFFARNSIAQFLFSSDWYPASGIYGARAFFSASLRTSVLAILFCYPLSLALAIFLSDYSADTLRRGYVVVLDILAAIPAVVYGLFAIAFLTPLLQQIFGINRMQPFNTLSAALVLGIFITPYTTSILYNGLMRSTLEVRRAAAALGATRAETIRGIVLPDAIPSLFSALILSLTRAMGESVIVGLVAGAGPRLTLNPLVSAETVTGFLLRLGSGGGEVVFAFAGLLFVITLGLNLLGDRISRSTWIEELR